MPYIKQEWRRKFTDLLKELDGMTLNEGEMNYVITKVCNELIKTGTYYGRINQIIGVLECVKLEFYRRIAIPYEEQKRKENGDVYK